MMENAYSLIANYSPSGDIFLIGLCLLMLLIANVSFIRDTRLFRLTNIAIILLIGSALSNLAFYTLIKLEYYTYFLFIFRDIYHVCLLGMFVIYHRYVLDLISLPEHLDNLYMQISRICFVVLSILDCLSPFTHLGLYLGADGIFRDNAFVKPFTWGYALGIIYVGIITLKYRKLLIKKVIRIMTITVAICVIITFTESLMDSNTLLGLTYSMPILVVIFIFHSNSYNVRNGSLDFSAFTNYLSSRNNKDKTDSFLCLKLFLDNELDIPVALGKVFYSFYSKPFPKANLFASGSFCYVLAIPDEYYKNSERSINELVNIIFPNEYKKFRFDYKVLAIPSANFPNVEKFEQFFSHYCQTMEMNSSRILGQKEMIEYTKIERILNELHDIHIKHDLNDPRVLAYCQPVKNTLTGEFDTGEALMRLSIPNIGTISPVLFIPLAEANDYIHTLSCIILNKTCAAIRQFIDDGYYVKRISVNFAIKELLDENFISDFTRIINYHGIDYSMIGIELTESQDDLSFEKIQRAVQTLKDMNVTMYLDDFGTGYSNIGRILKLQFDIIKTDRSLLLLTDTEGPQSQLLSSFSEAFKKLDLPLLFEGVETDLQESRCIEYGASYMQGFRFSKPIPIECVKDFLSKR